MIHPSKRLELLFLGALPASIALLLTVIYLATKHMSGLSQFMPLLPLMPVFYWGMMQARDMPYWFVFCMGLIMDAVTGLPLGLTSMLLIIFLLMVHAQRKYFFKEGFIIKWVYFAVIYAATAMLNSAMLAFFFAQPKPQLPVILQWLITLCVYPLLHKCFDAVYEHIHDRRWQILHGQ